MKIAFISAGVLPIPSVEGGAVENLVEFFLKQNEETGEHKITVYSIYTEEAFQKSKKYKHTQFIFVKAPTYNLKLDRLINKINNRLKNKVIIPNYFLRYIMKDIRKHTFDKVIIENRPYFGLFFRKKIPSSLILHLHNDTLNKDVSHAMKVFDSFDEIYVISEFIKNRVLTVKSTDKVKVLYNGIDTSAFNRHLNSEQYIKLRHLYNIGANDFVILYSGRINPDKGVKELIQAFNKIPNSGNIKLLIVGSAVYGKTVRDKYYDELENLIITNKSNIIFTGYIDYEQLPDIYELANIAVVPSIWEEPATLTTVEMMAMGLPVIISDAGGIHELVDELCSFQAKRGEKFVEELKMYMCVLINNPEIIETMAPICRKQAEKYDVKVYYQQFNRLLKESCIKYEK